MTLWIQHIKLSSSLGAVVHVLALQTKVGCFGRVYSADLTWLNDLTRTDIKGNYSYSIMNENSDVIVLLIYKSAQLSRTSHWNNWGARWLSGRVSDSGARGPGFETYLRRVVSLSKTLFSPKVLVNYPGSDGSVPTWLKNCWLGRYASTQPTNWDNILYLCPINSFKLSVQDWCVLCWVLTKFWQLYS